MKRFFIEIFTNWCGEQQEYVAYANDESELNSLVDLTAYDNFSDFDGYEAVLEELFPDVEDREYTDEMKEEADRVESEYWGSTISEWDESRPEKEWSWYEVLYDGREKENAEI